MRLRIIRDRATGTGLNMGKLEKLTEEQTAQIAVYRQRWLDFGLSTKPADREAAVRHIGDAYRVAGLNPPGIVIWLASPMAGAIGAHLLTKLPAEIAGSQVRAQVRAQVWDQVGDQVGSQVGSQVWDQVGDQVRAQVGSQVWDQVGSQVGSQVWDQVGDQVRAQVGSQVWDQVGSQVGSQVWDQVGAQVWAQVGSQVGSQVGAQVWAQVGAQVGDHVRAAIYGSHDANWLGVYEFFAAVCGLQAKVKKLEGLIGAGQTCGWWWPFKGAVILTERPCHLARDAQNRLHCETRAAVEYPDGWGVFAWRGTRVPKEWILEKDKLAPADALKQQNIEQRRAGCEILGWDRILRELQAKVINEDGDPEIGTLLRVDLPDAPNSQFLRVKCGTGRSFALPVPPTMRTALEANAWTFGIEPLDLKKLEVRT